MGNARVGKDTFAQYIAEKLGFVRIGLADPLKRFCHDVFEFTDEQLWGQERDHGDSRYPRNRRKIGEIDVGDVMMSDLLTPRYALQLLGTEWGRHCYDDVWIEYGIRVSKRLLKGDACYTAKAGLQLVPGTPAPTGVVFSDLRFRNEFDAVKKAGGTMIRIYRKGFDGTNLAGVSNHASEEEQRSIKDQEFDQVVANHWDLDTYFNTIDDLMAGILAKK